MFERFTERARQVVFLAQEEARTLRRGFIGTEHILLGIVREDAGSGAAARILDDFGADPETVRREVMRRLPPAGETTGDPLQRSGVAGSASRDEDGRGPVSTTPPGAALAFPSAYVSLRQQRSQP